MRSLHLDHLACRPWKAVATIAVSDAAGSMAAPTLDLTKLRSMFERQQVGGRYPSV